MSPLLPPAVAPLDALASEVSDLARRRKRPVAVFDLDDTLLSTAVRHLRILREFASRPEVRSRGPETAWTLGRIEAQVLRYSITDTALAAGVRDPELLKDLRAFWMDRFFANDYLLGDEPLAGAPAFCRDLRERGATVVYLTGRDESMRRGTLACLSRHGFPDPDGAGARLVLKPAFDTPDLEYKHEAVARVASWGAVAGAFENEPAHVNLFRDAFPEARVFFLDTKHSGKPVAPHPSAHWIRDFRRA